VPSSTAAAALDWIARWDIQQLATLPDREERFTALIDAVQEGTPGPDPLVLDSAAAPAHSPSGLLDRSSGATVVGVDADPLLLHAGRIGLAGACRAAFRRNRSSRSAGWPAELGLEPAGRRPR